METLSTILTASAPKIDFPVNKLPSSFRSNRTLESGEFTEPLLAKLPGLSKLETFESKRDCEAIEEPSPIKPWAYTEYSILLDTFAIIAVANIVDK